MNRQVQHAGVRRWAADDLLAMQNELFAVVEQALLRGLGNIIVSGCNISGSSLTQYNISSGFVYIDGNVCPFDGATDVSFPLYLNKVEEVTKTRPYRDGIDREISKTYKAVIGTQSMNSLDISLSNQNNPRLLLPHTRLGGSLSGIPKSDQTNSRNSNTLATSKAVGDLREFLTDLIGDRVDDHANNRNNPHQVTKAQVGLGELPNAKSDNINLDNSFFLATSAAIVRCKNFARNWNNTTNKPDIPSGTYTAFTDPSITYVKIGQDRFISGDEIAKTLAFEANKSLVYIEIEDQREGIATMLLGFADIKVRL